MRSSIDILLVEDSPGDVRLMQEILRKSEVLDSLYVAGDGIEAMAFLRREGQYAEAPRPALILLDLNLPRKNGHEVLAEIKADDELKRIPVVILTVSATEEDILKTYDLHANCYISKPIDLDQFTKVVKSIKDFWLTTAKLPPR